MLAAGYLLLAVPVALEYRWIGLAWGVMALATALTARYSVTGKFPEANAWLLSATGAVFVAWLRAFAGYAEAANFGPLFLNVDFGAALLAGAAAVILGRVLGLNRRETGFQIAGYAAAQLLLVNAVAWEWSRHLGRGFEAGFPLGALLGTLTYALAGATQWFLGVRRADSPLARGLRTAGYLWLGVASVKLLFADLGRSPMEYKAVAALLIGAVFIVTALLANRWARPAAVAVGTAPPTDSKGR